MKQPMHNRILSFLLAFLLFLSNVPFSVLSIGSSGDSAQSGSTAAPQLQYDYNTMYIARDGKQIQSLPLLSHEKIELSADGIAENAKYQWQVEHPEKEGVWVNVYDGTEKTISVTLALVENVLRENGTAKLRCRAYTDTYAYLSNTVTVVMAQEQTVSSKLAMAPGSAVVLADDEPVTPEFVTVAIRYQQYNWRKVEGELLLVCTNEDVFTPYIATYTYNAPYYGKTVETPNLVGYVNSVDKVTVNGVEYTGDDVQYADGTVSINFDYITADVVVYVKYVPDMVQYQVRYFFQNIYDDLYAENPLLKEPILDGQGYTATTPEFTQDKVHGFTCLWFEPEDIAADGSTVFYIYYERNYYLMEFDCDGGYGTETLYVRYGTHVAVPDPVKSGYAFDGWDLISVKNEEGQTQDVKFENGQLLPLTVATDTKVALNDGAVDVLPATLPHYNTAYKAVWKAVDTQYKIAYWLENGTERLYIGGYLESAVSGTYVSGGNTLGRTGIGAICGKLGHIHTGSCFNCGLADHEHEPSCLPSIITVGNRVTDQNDYNGMEAAKVAAGANFNPDEVYIFMIQASSDMNWRYWPKLYIDGTYYNMYVNGSDQILYNDPSGQQAMADITVGSAVASGKNGHTATIFKANLSAGCNQEVHVHAESCYTCNDSADDHVHDEECTKCKMHQHTSECRKDAHYLRYLRADQDVLVEGDGSSVVNIYYSFRSYTMRFYYARSKVMNGETVYSVVGGSTYKFGAFGDYSSYSVQQLLANVTDGWGDVTAKPQISSDDRSKYVTGSIEYDSITYHYLEFTAQFGADLENLWPVDIFEPVEIANPDNRTNRKGLKYAYFSAWNGEHKVKYTQDNANNNYQGGNETIKGLYMYLDEDVIFDPKFAEIEHTDTFGNQTTLVNFLGFWDNGADIPWSTPKEYTYHIMVQTGNASTKQEEQYDSKYFTEYKSFVVYDNNTLTEIVHQTPVALKGYKHIGTKTFNANYDTDYSTDPPVLESVDYYFYYVPNTHKIAFWNHSEYLSDGTGSSIVYGTPLQKYGTYASNMVYNSTNLTGKYPSRLEPGAYEFAGWYTSEACLPGTEMDWNQTMPDSDFIVYAKWEPIERDVFFYLTYDNMTDYLDLSDSDKVNVGQSYFCQMTNKDGNPITYPITITHGEVLGTAYTSFPVRYIDKNGDGRIDVDETEQYTFVGWFYMENGKKRFAPDTMEVKKDLHLFAEWRTEMDAEYTIHYVKKEGKTPIAEPTIGHMSAGHTKTFEAKAGDQLYTAYKDDLLFPTVSSHSILMDPIPENNVFTFEYVQEDKVLYQVQYVNKVTGLVLDQTAVIESTHATVTEKYKPIAGYIPENYYITRVLTADQNATTPIAENVIVFYYIPADTTALYTVQFYQENLDSTNSDIEGNYTLAKTEVFSGTIDQMMLVEVEPNHFTGFSYAFTTVTTYEPVGDTGTFEQSKSNHLTGKELSGKLTAGGLEFKIYYSRNSEGYSIKFMEWGTGKPLGYGKIGSAGRFETKDETKLKVGSEHSYAAADSFTLNTIEYYFYQTPEKPKTQTLTIQAGAQHNELVFYYKAKEVNIYYYAICLTPGAKDQEFGHVSVNMEKVTSSSTEGSTAMPSSGFRFVGWYTSPVCSEADKVPDEKVDSNYHLLPDRPDENVDYYALFEPITTDLTIKKDVDEAEATDNFLFRIQGQGKHAYIDLMVSITGDAFVVINNLPIGEYRITELTDWSWEYGDKPTWTFVVGSDTKAATGAAEITVGQDGGGITFTNTFTDSDWLENETSKENIFTGVTAP